MHVHFSLLLGSLVQEKTEGESESRESEMFDDTRCSYHDLTGKIMTCGPFKVNG